MARVLLPRLTRTTLLVCRALPFLSHSNEPAALSSSHLVTGSLMCSGECERVFTSLECTIRGSCKEIVFSYTYDIRVPPPAALVSITNVTAIDALPEQLKAAAPDISKDAGPVILIVTLQDQSVRCFTPTIMSLQQVLREVFSDHSGPVTVILRVSGKVPKSIDEGHGSSEVQTHATDPDPSPPDTDHLSSLVTSLLDQRSRGLHGLVLVV